MNKNELPDTDTKRFRLAWWHWVLLFLFLTVSIYYSILQGKRLQGNAKYNQTLTEVAFSEVRPSFNTFLNSYPDVDAALQSQWDNWCDRCPKYESDFLDIEQFKPGEAVPILTTSVPAHIAYLLKGDKSVVEEIRAHIDSVRPIMSEVIPFYRNPRLITTLIACYPATPPEERNAIIALRGLSLSAVRLLRRPLYWLRDNAIIAEDPHEYLMALDGEVRAGQYTVSMNEVGYWCNHNKTRDRTYLYCTLLGNIRADDYQQWVQEQSQTIKKTGQAFYAECLEIERIKTWSEKQGFSQLVFDNKLSEIYQGETDDKGEEILTAKLSRPWVWASIPNEAATIMRTLKAVADRLTGKNNDPIPNLNTDEHISIGSASPKKDIEIAVEFDVSFRLYRLAALIIVQARSSGLPATHADLVNLQLPYVSQLMTPTGDHLHLTYERLATDRL